MIKVLIADDQELIRESLSLMIGAYSDFQIAGSSAKTIRANGASGT